MTIQWREQRGSALLLVVFMILVFTMLGIAIIGATVGGAQRSVTREKDVQSLHLAEMALNEAAARVATYFDNKDDIDLEHLSVDLSAIEQEINAHAQTDSDIGKAAYGKIDKFIYNDGEAGEEIGGIVTKDYKITITAKAEVDGVTRILAQDLVLNSYPEFLKYTLGSEENVYMNGAPYILGDMYSGLQFWIKNQADYRYNLNASDPDLHQRTSYPTVDGGSIYIQDEKSIRACDSDLGYCNNANASDYKSVALNDPNSVQMKKVIGLTASDVKYREQNKFVSVNIQESFLDKIAEASGASKQERTEFYPKLGKINADMTSGQIQTIEEGNRTKITTYIQSHLIDTENGYVSLLPAKPTLAENATDEQIEAYNDSLAAYYDRLNGADLASSAIYNGPLTIDGVEFKKLKFDPAAKADRKENGTYMKSNWFIVQGDLTIDNLDTTAPLSVMGNILVTGNVLIKGKVSMDATIITLGSTTIQDGTIYGLKVNGEEKELLLISKGEILINRVDSFNKINDPYKSAASHPNRNPPILNAFLYTDDRAELYGVGSAFWIKGGFFAKKNLYINAVLGNTDPNEDETALKFNGMNLSSPTSEERQQSRFIIQYNDKIYKDQNVGLPRVKQINMTVGKKHFADSPK